MGRERGFLTDMVTAIKKPDHCPQCGSWRIADILYGEPAMSARLERDLEAGRIVLGGCVITDDSPAWECADCGAQIHDETGRIPLGRTKGRGA